MNTNYTIVYLAGVTAPLPLNAGCVPALLGIACLIDDTDSLWMGVIPSYPLQGSKFPRVGPEVTIRKLLGRVQAGIFNREQHTIHCVRSRIRS